MILCILFVLTLAQQVPGGQNDAPPLVVAASSVDETAPVAVPEPSDKALDYYRSGNVLWIVNQVASVALLLLILATGFSARMRDWSQRLGRKWFFTLIIYYLLFTVVTTVVSLPLSYYQEFVRQHAYGLSNQTLTKWWSDTLIALAVGCIIGGLVIWIPYLLLRKSPRRWWFYTSLAAIPFIVVVNLVEPIWIAPLFNKFEPMQDKALEARILTLADRAGIEGSRVYQVNKSVDTKTLNAYVAGVFGTKRIVLWDTIIDRMTPQELLFVMGHEMGHYVLGHVTQLILVLSVVLMLSLYVVYRASGFVLARWGERFGFSSLADIASLPLILLLANLFSLLITPGLLVVTRHMEHEADRFGLEVTQTSHSAGVAFVKLQTDALAIPRPGALFKLWRESHPPVGERIDFANDYHPWRDGQPLKYGAYFRQPK